jgi:hypothetical protein
MKAKPTLTITQEGDQPKRCAICNEGGRLDVLMGSGKARHNACEPGSDPWIRWFIQQPIRSDIGVDLFHKHLIKKGLFTMHEIASMTTPQLIEEYNRRTGRVITKFSTRAAGEKQLAEARIKNPSVLPTPPTNTQEIPVAHATKKKAAKAPKPVKAATVAGDRAKSISKSWKDPKVAAARKERTAVSVRGHGQFKSTGEAFKKLKLDANIGQVIKFRGALKAKGTGTFTSRNTAFHFSVVKA